MKQINNLFFIAASCAMAFAVQAEDKFGGCAFDFSHEKVARKFKTVGATLGLQGVENFRDTVFGDLCKLSPSSKFVLADNSPEGSSDVFRKPKDNWYVAKVLYNNQCEFEYEFGVAQSKFARKNNYAQRCLNAGTKPHGYEVLTNNGKSFSGTCSGSTFSGDYRASDGVYTVSGPKGSHWDRDKVNAIKKACG